MKNRIDMRLGRKHRRNLSLILVLAMVLSFMPADVSQAVSKNRVEYSDSWGWDDDSWDDDDSWNDDSWDDDSWNDDSWDDDESWDDDDSWNTPKPTVTPKPTATPKPTVKPKPTQAPKTSKYKKIGKKLLKLKKKYPEGKYWTNSNTYRWHALGYSLIACGCVSLACRLSDAVFGKKKKAKEIKSPSYKKVKIGDILRLNGDTHSAIVIDKTSSYLTIAEGNYNSSVHWGRKLSKNTKINYIWTRW